MNEKDRKLPFVGASIKPTAPASAKKERRRAGKRGQPPPPPKAIGAVGRDDLGNAVWEWRVDVPRRRDDDPTIDLVKCLDVGGLSIEDDEPKPRKQGAFNPYNKS
jgi:hypothetical protein